MVSPYITAHFASLILFSSLLFLQRIQTIVAPSTGTSQAVFVEVDTETCDTVRISPPENFLLTIQETENDVSCRSLINSSVHIFHVKRLKIFFGSAIAWPSLTPTNISYKPYKKILRCVTWKTWTELSMRERQETSFLVWETTLDGPRKREERTGGKCVSA